MQANSSDNNQSEDYVVYGLIAEIHLERLDLRLNKHGICGPKLLACLLSGFETLTELKLSVPLHLPHQIFFRTPWNALSG
uniref:Uncharacterized protein n=1 Tax=Romanomermis culicivorax TaxID=13658 RepID=A0A915HWU2_ROMCU